MSETCETVKIKDANAPGGHVIINKSDFDEDKHELLDAGEPLESMSKPELVQLAESHKLETKGLTKAQLIEAITKAEKV